MNRTDEVQELAELMESPPAGISVQLADESNLYEWKVYMEGPEGSPYHVRLFLSPTAYTHSHTHTHSPSTVHQIGRAHV